MLARIWYQNSPTLLRGMYKAAALENNLAMSQKIRHSVSVRPSNFTPILQENWKYRFTSKTCTWIFKVALFITVKTTQMSNQVING